MFKIRFLLISALALGSAGCSLLFVTPPAQERVGRCTRSKAMPVLDTLIGGYQVVRTGMAVSASDDAYQEAPISREADIGLGLGFTALFVGSAIYGYATTAECTKRKAHSLEYSSEDFQVSQPKKTTPKPAMTPVATPAPSPSAAAAAPPETTEVSASAGSAGTVTAPMPASSAAAVPQGGAPPR